jgi:hypothetical protein
LTFGGSMYFGHWGTGYVDKRCYPNNTATLGPSAWDVYYCESLSPIHEDC